MSRVKDKALGRKLVDPTNRDIICGDVAAGVDPLEVVDSVDGDARKRRSVGDVVGPVGVGDAVTGNPAKLSISVKVCQA